MAIPAEFERYREPRKSEENFIQKLLKPLLQRLGYYSIRDYHGTREFGKDLVFAEVDRFAEISYHGLQAKYEENISLAMADDLANDAIQAFTNPFEHPSTHQPLRITTFVAVNAGTVSEQAKTHFFNKVGAQAGSCRILEGRDILTLDRAAYLGRGQLVTETLDGLLVEINFNLNMVHGILTALDQVPRPIQVNRLSDSACTNYLVHPFGGATINVNVVLGYAQQVRMMNKCLDGLAGPISVEPTVAPYIAGIRGIAPVIRSDSDRLIGEINKVLAELRPLIEISG
jgi:hypothetical protein